MLSVCRREPATDSGAACSRELCSKGRRSVTCPLTVSPCSAPPNYDGNLARYLEADAHISDPHAYAIRPLDPDIDFLPDYS